MKIDCNIKRHQVVTDYVYLTRFKWQWIGHIVRRIDDHWSRESGSDA